MSRAKSTRACNESTRFPAICRIRRAVQHACVSEALERRTLFAVNLLDTSFGGGDGLVTTDFQQNAELKDIAVLPDGKIVAAGTVRGLKDNDFGLARYNPDGSLDHTFGGGDGMVVFPVGQADDDVAALRLLPDGRILSRAPPSAAQRPDATSRWSAATPTEVPTHLSAAATARSSPPSDPVTRPTTLRQWTCSPMAEPPLSAWQRGAERTWSQCGIRLQAI